MKFRSGWLLVGTAEPDDDDDDDDYDVHANFREKIIEALKRIVWENARLALYQNNKATKCWKRENHQMLDKKKSHFAMLPSLFETANSVVMSAVFRSGR